MLGLPAATLVAAISLGTTAGLQDSVRAFVNVSVIPMDREQMLADQTVLVQGDRITVIGPAKTVTIPANATRIDGRGKFLIPGLADMHAHIFTAPTTGAEQYANVLLNYLANGVTTVRMMAGEPWQLDMRERVARSELLGPTLYISSPQLKELNSAEEAVQLVAEYKAAGYDLIKMYEPELSLEVLDSFAAAAHRAKMPFGGHYPRGAVTLERWLKAQPISIEHLQQFFEDAMPPGDYEISIDSVHFDEARLAAVAAAVKRASVWSVPTLGLYYTPATAVRFGSTPARFKFALALFDTIVKALREGGVRFLTGTDAGLVDGRPWVDGLIPGLSIHQELEMLVKDGLTPYQALEASTRNVAVFLNALDRRGTIEVGKRADLVLLSGNPLDDIRNTKHPAGVMIGGRWLPREELKIRLTTLKVPDDWW